MTQVATSRNLTDRARRYRAQHPAVRPQDPRRCGFCGSTENVGVHHVDGDEHDGSRHNLMWACKSCNAKIAHLMKQAGIGRRTVQYNPARGSRKAQMDAYAAAIKVMRGEFEGDVAKAVSTIKGTDPEIRSRYTARTWATRRQLYGPSGRGNMAKHRRRNLFGLSFGKTSRSETPIMTIAGKSKVYKGHRIDKLTSGQFEVPSIERGSYLDSLKDAHRFIDQWRRNPPKVDYILTRVDGKYKLERKLGATSKRVVGVYDTHAKAEAARKQDWTKNPGKGSFTRCVKAVTKRGGVDDPRAVCAASKMRRPGGKAELLAAARRGKLQAMSSKNPFLTMREGKATADIFQTSPHEFTVTIGDETKQFKTFKAAQSWARLRLHEVSNPRGIRVKVYARKPTKTRNPMDQAAKLYQEFHGFPSTEVIEFVEQVHYHSVTTSLGPLVSMIVRIGKNEPFRLKAPDPAEAKIEDIVYLTSTEDGRQLIPVGGNQSVPIDQLSKFGLDKEDQRDHMLLGEIQQVTYRTRKTFEEDGQVAIDFYHDLGGEHSKGKLPVLIYKPRNPSMEIAGGRYFIGKPDKSLGNVSPGIVG